jgi:thiol-disulfide isomerase/thioredoxin
MKKFVLIIIALLFQRFTAYTQSDTILDSRIVFLDKQETLDKQLKQFDGKIVYVDTWATYCSPCIKHFKNKKDYEEFFINNDIVVLCLCIDQSNRTDSWRELVNKYVVTGYHVFVERDSLEDYLVDLRASKNCIKSLGRGFPRFLIVDKNGNVVEDWAFAPSDNLIDQMRKYLEN